MSNKIPPRTSPIVPQSKFKFISFLKIRLFWNSFGENFNIVLTWRLFRHFLCLQYFQCLTDLDPLSVCFSFQNFSQWICWICSFVYFQNYILYVAFLNKSKEIIFGKGPFLRFISSGFMIFWIIYSSSYSFFLFSD